MIKLIDLLNEGVRDPGIFKAIFLAGGPGSGKSYVAQQLFGIPEKVNVSTYGLKMVNQDQELEMFLKKYFGTLDIDNMPKELFKQLTDPDYEDYSGLRGYTKDLSRARLGKRNTTTKITPRYSRKVLERSSRKYGIFSRTIWKC
jgi:adenylate kinase family enzyme